MEATNTKKLLWPNST